MEGGPDPNRPPFPLVLMEVETLGMARSLGWKVHMRCASGYRESTRSMRRCVYRKQLDLETLVCTRGSKPMRARRSNPAEADLLVAGTSKCNCYLVAIEYL